MRVARTEKGSLGGGPRVGHAFQIALVLFALIWLTIGFGVIDLVSGFTPPYNSDGTNVLSSAYGAIAAVVLLWSCHLPCSRNCAHDRRASRPYKSLRPWHSPSHSPAY